MKYTIKQSGKFKRSYKLAQKRGLNISILKDVVTKLANGIQLDENTKTMH